MAKVYFEKNRVFLPKLIGAFFVTFALVMFVISCAKMYDTWDTLKQYPNCLAKVGSETGADAYMQYSDCKQSLYNITGLQLRGDQAKISQRQFFVALLGPVAELLFWAIVFLVGLQLYSMRLVRGVAGQPPVRKKK